MDQNTSPTLPSQIHTFRIGSKNRRIEDEFTPNSGYRFVPETGFSLPELLAWNGVVVAPNETLLTPRNFPCEYDPTPARHFELFDFSARSDYGRSGVDEAFVRDKLTHFKFRPGTLAELICMAGHLHKIHASQWFEARKIIALGSVFEATGTARKKGWFFSRRVTGHFRYYPELECVAGRPQDILTLSRTDLDSDGNWPNSTLFLAASLAPG